MLRETSNSLMLIILRFFSLGHYLSAELTEENLFEFTCKIFFATPFLHKAIYPHKNSEIVYKEPYVVEARKIKILIKIIWD